MTLRHGGIEMTLRIDRIDRVDDRLIVVDYKTGTHDSIARWPRTRLAAPQLPLYALAEEKVSGVAFARVVPWQAGFAGIAADAGLLPGVGCGPRGDERDWTAWRAHWRGALDRVAGEVRAGEAGVLPRAGRLRLLRARSAVPHRRGGAPPRGRRGGGCRDGGRRGRRDGWRGGRRGARRGGRRAVRAGRAVSAAPADAAERARALDPARSFIVQAPAGSGKTELLTRRVLTLLARVDEPEQVLAITFTRKAAAEMRHRVVAALARAARGRARGERLRGGGSGARRAALERDAVRGWHLLDDPGRLSMRTIDSLATALAHRLPMVSALGAAIGTVDDPRALHLEAAERFLDHHLASIERGLPAA